MFTWRYYVTLFAVAIGASFQFYSYGVVNPPQRLLEAWLRDVYRNRSADGVGNLFALLRRVKYVCCLTVSIRTGARFCVATELTRLELPIALSEGNVINVK